MIEIKITTDKEVIIKRAKPRTTTAGIYLPESYRNKELYVVVCNPDNDCDIIENKGITTLSTSDAVIFEKISRTKGKVIITVPMEYVGYDCIVIPKD